MERFTLAEIKTRVKRNLDIEEQDFVIDAELTEYVNDAIDDIEAELVNMGDYLLANEGLSLVSSTKAYSLPSNIFASKIRRIQFNDSVDSYQIQKLELNEIPTLDDTSINTKPIYYYNIMTDDTNGPQLYIYPTPATSDSTSITIYYIKNLIRVSADTDVVDVPEFVNYILRKVEYLVYKKEGNPLLTQAKADFEQEKLKMLQTLSDENLDDGGALLLDTSHYEDEDSFDGETIDG